MSFILDALKKSEAERRQGDVPGLQNEPGAPPPRSRSVWPFVLTLALLFNGVVLGWWLLAWEGTPLQGEKAAGTGSAAPAVASGFVPNLESRPVPAAIPSSGLVAADPVSTGASQEPSDLAQAGTAWAGSPLSEHPAPPKIPEEAPSPSRAKAQSTVSEVLEPHSPPSASSDAEMFPPLAKLPSHLRSGLPKLSLQLHFYSPSPANRLVRLNGVNLREGSKGTDGLSVVEILPDGINLSCSGVRFFLPTAWR